MKTILIIIGLIILIGCSRDENFRHLENTCSSFDYSPEHYRDLSNCYETNRYLFLDSTAIYYELYENMAERYGENFEMVSEGEVAPVIKKVNKLVGDTSNYIWGEAGTPWTQFRLDFINKEGQIVNRIKIAPYGGMLWTTPSFGTTKWGGLSDLGFDKTMDLIKYLKTNTNSK